VGFGLALAFLGEAYAVGDRRWRPPKQLAEPVASPGFAHGPILLRLEGSRPTVLAVVQ